MIWRKLLLEIGAVSGLGGGIGGYFNSGAGGGGIHLETEKESILLGTNSELKKEKQKTKKSSQKINNLNKTALGPWRWKSEGVGQEFLFVEGWDNAGPHKIIESSEHSQSIRELYGGTKVSGTMSWFGPRKVTKELEEIEEVKENSKNINVSYWPKIQESGKYIDQKDLNGLQKFWSTRTKEFEEDIFGLYHDRNWWIKQFERKRNKDLVDLEFDLSKVRTMLNKTEDQLRDDPWTYGAIFQNPKLAVVRLLGNVEETGFNYLKHLAWPDKGKVKSLKEKKIAFAIVGLILGEEYGFDCQSGQEDHKTQFFKECEREHIGKIRNDGKVKRVLKTTWKYSGKYSVPKAHLGGSWWNQPKLETQQEKELLKMDDIQKTALLNEKCEEEGGWFTWGTWTDTTIKIRREVCDQIIRPWFGDNVSDKRLCLIEIPEHNYYLRLSTYLEVLPIPTWINKNTFWTKCSNYSI